MGRNMVFSPDLVTGNFDYFNYYIDLVGNIWWILVDFGKLNRMLDRKGKKKHFGKRETLLNSQRLS